MVKFFHAWSLSGVDPLAGAAAIKGYGSCGELGLNAKPEIHSISVQPLTVSELASDGRRRIARVMQRLRSLKQ
jgi:hypothetical protein